MSKAFVILACAAAVAALPARTESAGKTLSAAEGSANDDELTILNTNTYLLAAPKTIELVKKPNSDVRADGYVEWFKSLSPEEVPDVVVWQEMMSSFGESVIQRLCTSEWYEAYETGRNCEKCQFKTMACDEASHFGETTAIVGATTGFNPLSDGGVVIFVKKGIKILQAEDEVFKDAGGEDAMSRKGFWSIQIQKGGQTYWVVATHTQAYEGQSNIEIRKKQFAQMRAHVDEVASAGDRLVYSGDMNVFVHPFGGSDVDGHELDGMLETLGAPGVPVSGGTLVPAGFWRPLQAEISDTVEVDHLHYIYYDEGEAKFGDQHFDWVLVPQEGDTFAAPAEMRYQMLPMKHPSGCFQSGKPYADRGAQKGTYTDDLSDHYAVFAQVCYAGPCGSVPRLTVNADHVLPQGPTCTEGMPKID